jgi:hypothetical protein
VAEETQDEKDSMTDLPNPLTPADCDLRDFPYMPLDVQRLCDSDLAALESPEACWAALLLWSKSWHQVPAASLPDDDRVLAKFTGYQRAPDAWKAIRDGALRGWIKCSDGRLYHPVVAEKANEGWFAKHRQAHEKLCERMRKRNKARIDSGLVPLEVPELEQWIDVGRPLEKSLFPSEFSTPSSGKNKQAKGSDEEFRRNDDEIPPENALKGREGKGEGKEVNPSGSTNAPATSSRACASPAELSAAMRRCSIDSQPGDPRVIAAAENGVIAETVTAACAEAKSKKPGQRISAGYVLTIAEAWTREAAAPRPAPGARAIPINARDESRRRAYEVLTGKTEPATQPDPEILDGHAKLVG